MLCSGRGGGGLPEGTGDGCDPGGAPRAPPWRSRRACCPRSDAGSTSSPTPVGRRSLLRCGGGGCPPTRTHFLRRQRELGGCSALPTSLSSLMSLYLSRSRSRSHSLSLCPPPPPQWPRPSQRGPVSDLRPSAGDQSWNQAISCARCVCVCARAGTCVRACCVSVSASVSLRLCLFVCACVHACAASPRVCGQVRNRRDSMGGGGVMCVRALSGRVRAARARICSRMRVRITPAYPCGCGWGGGCLSRHEGERARARACARARTWLRTWLRTRARACARARTWLRTRGVCVCVCVIRGEAIDPHRGHPTQASPGQIKHDCNTPIATRRLQHADCNTPTATRRLQHCNRQIKRDCNGVTRRRSSASPPD
jgi:hypothetical protein